jgi:hypothetical protein
MLIVMVIMISSVVQGRSNQGFFNPFMVVVSSGFYSCAKISIIVLVMVVVIVLPPPE